MQIKSLNYFGQKWDLRMVIEQLAMKITQKCGLDLINKNIVIFSTPPTITQRKFTSNILFQWIIY